MKKITNITGIVLFVVVMALLMVAGMTRNKVDEDRNENNYKLVYDTDYVRMEDENAPLGVVDCYRFNLGTIDRADMLVFYINHNYVSVYIDDEPVYSVTGNSGIIDTPGGIWATIPLYQEDENRTVRVELRPVYSDYMDETPEMIVGSELEIYKRYFYKAMPELILSLCVILAGVFLLVFAAYHRIRKNYISRLYAIGVLSVSSGMWRFSYEKFSYLILRNHTVWLYTLSIISLMLVALSMLNCVEIREDKRQKRAIQYMSLTYMFIYIVQLILQLTGLLDLRQTLKAVHITIVISAVVLCTNGIVILIKKEPIINYSGLLGIGAIVDLILYYFFQTSVSMLFTLGAVLCYSMIEGIRMFIDYTEQKNALAEMEGRLMLSRTTTMMSQIRSHFVFNLLNAISGMCKYNPEKADDTIVRFSRYLRNNIDIMENDKNIPFTTDIQQLEDYVVLEQVRFGDKIEFYTDTEVTDFMIPPLILQPVVENAIKHGVSQKTGNGTIILKTWETKSHVMITVEDDGIGFDISELEKEKSVGIRNIIFRLKHLVDGDMKIESEIGKGTVVTISIPKKEEHR